MYKTKIKSNSSQYLHNFLNDSFLFQQNNFINKFSKYTDRQLRNELQRYREYVLSRSNDLQSNIKENSNHLKMFVGNDCLPLEKLKQSVLYFDQVVYPDPLFELTYSPSKSSSAVGEYLNLTKNSGFNRERLVNAIENIFNLKPMSVENYLIFAPISILDEPPEEIPLRHSKTAFSDVLPPSILEEYRRSVQIYSMEHSNGKTILADKLRVGRHIAIRLKGDSSNKFYGYSLLKSNFDEVGSEFTLSMNLPNEAPSHEEFEVWVNQSINQTAASHFTNLLNEISLSNQYRASYLTTSDLNAKLLGVELSHQSIKQFSSNCILNIELPFITNISLDNLMKIRNNESEAFQNFRTELERNFRELRLEADPRNLKIKIENVIHELTEVQVTKIDQDLKKLKVSKLKKVGISTANLISNLYSLNPIGAIESISQIGSAFQNKNIKQNPSYFLWKIKQSN